MCYYIVEDKKKDKKKFPWKNLLPKQYFFKIKIWRSFEWILTCKLSFFIFFFMRERLIMQLYSKVNNVRNVGNLAVRALWRYYCPFSRHLMSEAATVSHVLCNSPPNEVYSLWTDLFFFFNFELQLKILKIPFPSCNRSLENPLHLLIWKIN